MHTHLVPNTCRTNNGGCSHFCLMSAVDPRGYSCDCSDGMILDDGQSNCTFQNKISFLSPSSQIGYSLRMNMTRKLLLLLSGSCVASGHTSCCGCQDNSTTCYCDAACHSSRYEDCCSDVPLDCEQGMYTHLVL